VTVRSAALRQFVWVPRKTVWHDQHPLHCWIVQSFPSFPAKSWGGLGGCWQMPPLQTS